MQTQKTYTCRCGKKRALVSGETKCGCGRIAIIVDGKVTIKNKS